MQPFFHNSYSFLDRPSISDDTLSLYFTPNQFIKKRNKRRFFVGLQKYE